MFLFFLLLFSCALPHLFTRRPLIPSHFRVRVPCHCCPALSENLPAAPPQAVELLNDKEIEGVKFYIALAQKKSDREKELREKYELMRLDRQKRYGGVNLYVKNLSDELTDDELRTEFAKYGDISSAKIMRDETTTRSRGFGFVCFTSADDSTRAVTEMNGKMMQGKPLYVAIAQRKDARRAHLEATRSQNMMPAGMYGGAPMFYAPMPGMQGGPRPGPGGFMYPPMMPPNMRFPQQRGPGGPQYAMGPGGMPRGAMPGAAGYALVPAQMPGNMGGAPGAGPRQQRPPRQQQQQQGGPAGAAQQQQQSRPIAQQQQQGGARPAQGGAPAAGGRPAQQQQQGARRAGDSALLPGGSGAQPLTLSSLVNATPEVQKQLIGERLYPLVAGKQPEQAGKITGMLLEMDNAELLELLDSEEARDAKIVEALRVLQEADAAQAAQQQ